MNSRFCDRINELAKIAGKKFKTYFSLPLISYNLTGTNAGQAWPTKWEIKVNAKLATENFDEYVYQTIPHEFAHLVAYRQYGGSIKPHGKEWQEIMKFFGLKPIRCHQYVISAYERCPYEWRCKCRSFFFSLRKHKRYLHEGKLAKWTCQKCKTKACYAKQWFVSQKLEHIIKADPDFLKEQ
jgi:SprT protein